MRDMEAIRGMDGAPELEVAAQADRQISEPALFTLDGEHIGQRLGRVVVAAVARVDNRNCRFHGRDQRRALFGMAHGDNVGIAADGEHGVRNALPFLQPSWNPPTKSR